MCHIVVGASAAVVVRLPEVRARVIEQAMGLNGTETRIRATVNELSARGDSGCGQFVANFPDSRLDPVDHEKSAFSQSGQVTIQAVVCCFSIIWQSWLSGKRENRDEVWFCKKSKTRCGSCTPS